MPLMAHHASASWSLAIPLALLIITTAVLYLRGWHALSKHSGSFLPFWRAASFFIGLGLIWVAIGSPLAELDHQYLTAHMVQHLLLMAIAPAFILLGDPVRSISQGLPRRLAHGVVSPFFSWPSLRHLGKFLSNPVVCWLPATAALIAWHVPSIFALAMQFPPLHRLEHTTFLVAGFLFWWPVIQPWPSVPIWPRWPILLYLFLATIPCDILSAYLTFCDTIVYTSYLNLPHSSQLSVLRDQQFAGSLMWACVTIIYLIPAAILTVRLLEQPSKGRPSAVASVHAETGRF